MISQFSPSSLRSSAPASSTISVSLSSSTLFATTMTPFFVNICETDPGAPRFPAVLRKRMPNLARRAVLIVRQHVDENCHATRTVALVRHFFVAGTLKLARTLLDGALDVVLGHVLGLGRRDRTAQPRVAVGIASAALRGDGDFLDQACENLAALGIQRALLMLNCRPF